MSHIYLGFKFQWYRFSVGFLIPELGSSQPVLFCSCPCWTREKGWCWSRKLTGNWIFCVLWGAGRRYCSCPYTLISNVYIRIPRRRRWEVMWFYFSGSSNLLHSRQWFVWGMWIYEFCKYLEIQFAQQSFFSLKYHSMLCLGFLRESNFSNSPLIGVVLLSSAQTQLHPWLVKRRWRKRTPVLNRMILYCKQALFMLNYPS